MARNELVADDHRIWHCDAWWSGPTAAVLCLLWSASVFGSPLVSSEDADLLRTEALADRAPERMHGRFDFMLEDMDAGVDRTTGQGLNASDDDCANVPVITRRADGRVVKRRVNVCD